MVGSSTGVGPVRVNSEARASPWAAVAIRSRPSRLAANRARSADSRRFSAEAPSLGKAATPMDAEAMMPAAAQREPSASVRGSPEDRERPGVRVG
jgi:hypothetical protein